MKQNQSYERRGVIILSLDNSRSVFRVMGAIKFFWDFKLPFILQL